jgi:uncharacterized protein YqjF (DUF2071 family)
MDVGQLFLTAEWRDLILLNYEVDASLLQAFVPAGTELERWQGRVFLSLVGFRFLNTRVFRLPVPFHRNFEEVNLRFYVRRKEGNEVKRGVVFVREIVPRWAIAAVARTLYNENYIALPMAHRIDRGAGFLSAECARAWPMSRHCRVPGRKRNSSPNITGATPRSQKAAAWNIE